MGRFRSSKKLLLRHEPYPRRCVNGNKPLLMRCKDGNNLADPERCGKAGGWQDEKRQGG